MDADLRRAVSGLVSYRADDLSARHAVAGLDRRVHGLEAGEAAIVVLHRDYASVDHSARGHHDAGRRRRDGRADVAFEVHAAMTGKPRLQRDPGQADYVQR